ncbi:hypothetical protein R69746_04426 [Paraburkholderia aspalathi]|uniref:DUF4393 domain-containing protein n=1 Tax=Paraburkholderia aspalathi TaxID=1324617 RepID=UPI00190A03E6|nr:DUF4393 domain-containing protein [Paraburkholderia aspalathi]MBK3840492.1 DUF4393 domain-containing protein [Paraburkholderia aspalathi]CAE6784101.1 hypothetical protein R69746_04426 [Paraburkholderia aspalathi]
MSDDDSANPMETAKGAVELVGAVIKIAGDHPDVKAAGGNLAKSAKTLTEFINVGLLPIAAINYGYDKARSYFEKRFSADVETAAGNIPPENLQEPASSVIGPVLQGLAFTHEDDNLKDMYLRLIATAMDSRHAKKAHPAFAEIIRQLSGFEAGLLKTTLANLALPIVEIRMGTYDEKMQFSKFSFPSSYRTLQTHVLPLGNADGTPFVSQELPAMVDNWVRLGLVSVSYDTSFTVENSYDWVKTRPEFLYWVPQDAPPLAKLDMAKGQLKSTAFGLQFATVIGARGKA